MTIENTFPHLKVSLTRLGYKENYIEEILKELYTLFEEIEFEKIKQTADAAIVAKDTAGLINSLKDLMLRLENKGYYRPDAPTRLIRQLVNGLNLANEDIFFLLDNADIPEKEKLEEMELLASCAAITQLGYILSGSIVPEVKAASAGPHVFLMIDGFSPDSIIFVDFSIDSIKEIDSRKYEQKGNYCHLLNTRGLDGETVELLTQYYSSFHMTSGIGLSHNIHNNLGLAYDRIGKYEEAIRELKEALRLNPDYIEVHNNLGVTYDRMGMPEEAVNELKRALKLNPNYTEAHCNLGNIYASSDRYEEAAGELEEALKINPDFAIAHNNLGNIYALQKRNEEAIKEFREALRINPDYVPAHNNLGNAYAEAGRFEDALREFQEALRLNPEFPEAYLGMGLAYYAQNSFDRAAIAMIHAVCLTPAFLECVPDKLLLKVKQGVSRLKGRM
ncbi:MAG: tetratricopeptide repeat protein [Candidatus Methanoperedens sp.]|nr:tetratricopeptide repeat protein [Candidatus Methanoperedens sp.]MCZ7404946.1 tetratricopeptide repeat protein [Candidatus Methanoperedens sp.]